MSWLLDLAVEVVLMVAEGAVASRTTEAQARAPAGPGAQVVRDG